MKILLLAGAVALALTPFGTTAQIRDRFGRAIDPGASAIVDKNGNPVDASNPLPVQPSGRTEAVQLIAASASTGAQMLLGGRYAFAQACLNYNGQAISLRYRGPDGTAMQTAATKSSADTSLVEVPAGAVIDATVPSAAIGCNASMTRIPQ
ncbi:hypothetical protein [Sphingomonas zeae]